MNKAGFDFSALDTVKKSEDGVLFLFLDMNGEELDAGAVMHGPDSTAYKRAHAEFRAKFIKANSKRKDGEELDLEDDEKLEKVIACCVRLDGCFIGNKEYRDNRDDIREFFTKLPMMRDQMFARITGRANFLPDAAKAGSTTSDKTPG